MNGEFVRRGAADEGGDEFGFDRKVIHRAVANIGAAARQAVFVVAEFLEMFAPAFAPKAFGDEPSAGEWANGLDGLARLFSFSIFFSVFSRRLATGT